MLFLPTNGTIIFEPYLNTMCNFKQYLDRQYAINYLLDNGRDDIARIYSKIVEITFEMGNLIPQDFSAIEMFGDKSKLKPYCHMLLEICALEEKVSKYIENT